MLHDHQTDGMNSTLRTMVTGPEPGEPGRAVIAATSTRRTGPDVFFPLGQARAGDRIEVRLADRSTVTFLVQTVEVHPRDNFPTTRVYGTDGATELRLITCTGATTPPGGVTRTTSWCSPASPRGAEGRRSSQHSSCNRRNALWEAHPPGLRCGAEGIAEITQFRG